MTSHHPYCCTTAVLQQDPPAQKFLSSVTYVSLRTLSGSVCLLTAVFDCDRYHYFTAATVPYATAPLSRRYNSPVQKIRGTYGIIIRGILVQRYTTVEPPRSMYYTSWCTGSKIASAPKSLRTLISVLCRWAAPLSQNRGRKNLDKS